MPSYEITFGALHRIGDSDDIRLDGRAYGGDLTPWFVTFEARFVGDHLAITSVHVDTDPMEVAGTSQTPRGGITSQVMKRVKIGELLAASNAEVRRLAEDDPLLQAVRGGERSDDDQSFRERVVERGTRQRPPQGRKPLPDEYLCRVAMERLQVMKEGFNAPNGELAHRLGVSVATAKKHVRRARDAGFLAPGEPGRSTVSEGPRFPECNDIQKKDNEQ